MVVQQRVCCKLQPTAGAHTRKIAPFEIAIQYGGYNLASSFCTPTTAMGTKTQIECY